MWEKIIGSKIYTAIFLAIVFFVGLAATYLFLSFSKIFVKNPLRNILPTPNAYTFASPKPIEQFEPEHQEKGTYNILFLGYGGAGHEGSLLTDSIILLHVDTNSHKAAFISVPRDLWVNGNHKINAAGISGFQDSKPIVTGVTGLPVNYYVSVDFGGFTKIIDDLGGITVQVPATFDDPFYPITGEENNTCGKTEQEINLLKTKYSGYSLETKFTCRYEHLHFDKGEVNLDGATALKFARSRHGDSDFGRSLRQFAILGGIKNKLISFQMTSKFEEIVGTLLHIVRTDLDPSIIKALVQIVGDVKAYSIKQIQLTTDNVLNQSTSNNGQFILIPKSGNFNFSGIKEYISSNIK